MPMTIIYVHVYITLGFPVTHRNASVLCQKVLACVHTPVNIAVFFVKGNENTNPKGRSLVQMYRVVPQT